MKLKKIINIFFLFLKFNPKNNVINIVFMNLFDILLHDTNNIKLC